MATENQVVISSQIELPKEFEDYVNSKIAQNGAGGRPHIIAKLAKTLDAKEETLNILELIWIKNRGIGSIAKKYEVEYSTIYRLLKDLDPLKEAIVTYLRQVPRRKVFYNEATDASDYETVQNYIRRSRRQERRDYKRYVRLAMQCWQHLKYKDPENWSADDVTEYLQTKSKSQQYQILCAIRAVSPQIQNQHSREYVSTGQYYDKIGIRTSDVFQAEVNLILKALVATHLPYHAAIFKLHVTLGAREGKKNSTSGMSGITWERFKHNFQTVDLWESKVKGGIWSRGCPVDLFFTELPQELQDIWANRGKPTTAPLVLRAYEELRQIYKEIRAALTVYYEGKLEPSLYKELINIHPHDADKIHVNLCWEAEIPLEVVAGQFRGRGEGQGLVGRIWLTLDVIKKYYLSLNQKSKRFQKIRANVHKYSEGFYGRPETSTDVQRGE